MNLTILKKYFFNTVILFLAIFAFDFFFNGYNYFSRIIKVFFFVEHKVQIKYTIIILNYISQLILITLILSNKSRILRFAMNIFLFITISIFLTYYYINGYGFTLNEAITAVSEFAFAGDAFINFGNKIFLAILITMTFVSILNIFSRRYGLNHIKPILLSTIFFVLIGLYILSGRFTNGNPIFHSIPFKVVFNYYSAFTRPIYIGVKQPVSREHKDSKIDKIIYIVDESITGKILSINGFEKETTPFLKSKKNNIINFGIASSVGNCSQLSNTILRTGLLPTMIPDTKQLCLKNPNIWAYAKNAGYYTVYINAQRTSSALGNNMNKFDLDTIDEYIYANINSPEYMKDFDIIDILYKRLKQHKKIFIYVNKMGAHFHYEDRYPQKYKFFSPTLKIGEAPSINLKDKMLNSYYNAIRYSVDMWWKKVFEKFYDTNSLFIYTSDHGQTLFEGNTIVTHCDKNPNMNEANVPLFIVPFGETKSLIHQLTNKYFNININNATDFNIFPTILFLEGYTLNNNELSLFDDLSEQNSYFYSGPILGRVPPQRNIFISNCKEQK